jgi:hypothetical protein
VGQAEQQRGDNQAKLLLERAPEKRFLTHPGEDRDQHEAARSGVVDQAWGELFGDLTQGGYEPVGKEAQGDRAGGRNDPE